MSIPYQKISITLISDLHPRTRDILAKRFGLDARDPETLEAIGQAHGITRERVRQIVEDGIRQVKDGIQQGKEQARLQHIFGLVSDTLKETGSIKKEDLLVDALDAREASNSVVFLLHLDDWFWKQKETEHFYPFWANKKEIFESTPSILEFLVKHFDEHNETLLIEEVVNVCRKSAHGKEAAKMNAQTLVSLLEVSKHTTQGYNGKWGLKKWPEVYPKGMRDKAYVVLKNIEKPLHFVEVADAIAELQASLADQKKKKILPQTVHNELIKDARFVLVGRGTYALSEWGYEPGTVRDIIIGVLQGNGSSMDKDEIIQRTLEQRQVKSSTILLNLQDRSCFVRDSEGRYYVKE